MIQKAKVLNLRRLKKILPLRAESTTHSALSHTHPKPTLTRTPKLTLKHTPALSHGVKVAQEILVLSVQVRILVGQHL